MCYFILTYVTLNIQLSYTNAPYDKKKEKKNIAQHFKLPAEK